MKKGLIFAFLLALLLVFSPVIRANDDDDDIVIEEMGQGDSEAVEEDFDEISTSDLQFFHLFPDAPLGNIESGKVANILIGVVNNGDSEYTLHTLEASFRYPLDFNQVLQNFTTYRYGVSLKPGEEATLSYKWPIQPLFEPVEYGFTVLVGVEDADGIVFQAAGFNGTITVVDPIRSFDLEALFIVVFGAAFLGGVGYVVNKTLFAGKKPLKFRPAAPKEEKAVPQTKEEKREEKRESAPDMSWIPQHNIKKATPESPRRR